MHILKKIMIIAGGEWQVPLARKAKESGFYVICSNLYENSPAFFYADACEIADVMDIEKNIEFARKHHPDAVITDQSDIAVPTVARVCEALNLHGIGSEKALLFTNKHKMRRFCREAGFPAPSYRLCRTPEEIVSFFKKHKKIIIKPIDCQSSRGVFTISNIKDIYSCFDETINYSHAEQALLAEEFISGTEFTVDGIQTPDAYHTLAISEKKPFRENPNVAQELLFSHSGEKFDYTLLRKTNDELVRAMKLPFGLTHAEYKYMNGQYYLIEIAARGGGTKISSDIVPLMSGTDSMHMLIQMALGQTPVIRPSYPGRCTVLKFLQFPSGVVKKIHGIREIREIPGVHDINLNFHEGDQILPVCDDRSRHGYYIAYADTREHLFSLQQKIESCLSIEYENNFKQV